MLSGQKMRTQEQSVPILKLNSTQFFFSTIDIKIFTYVGVQYFLLDIVNKCLKNFGFLQFFNVLYCFYWEQMENAKTTPVRV